MELKIEILQALLLESNITVTEVIHNSKSSESYVRTIFKQDDGFEWETVVPYNIRRSGLFLETEEEVADYLKSIKPYFTKQYMVVHGTI